MAQYAIAFDMDTTAMKADGLSQSSITGLYQTEIPNALNAAGFTAHPQGSLYHTEDDQNPITAIMQLQNILRAQAPIFCRYVRRVHIFRMEEWSDVTALILQKPSIPPSLVTPEEEIEEQEIINNSNITSNLIHQI